MTIKIGEKIRFLRRENNITQDTLAEYLGVTSQAISRWESETCYPDIEILPSIASFFGISIDELLGYDPSMERQREVILRLQNLIIRGDPSALDECRKASALYPKNTAISVLLSSQIFLRSPAGDSKMLEEGMAICRRILDEIKLKTEDQMIMLGAKNIIIMSLLKNRMKKEAYEIAYTMPSIVMTRDYMLPLTLEGEGCHEYIRTSLPLVITMIMSVYLQPLYHSDEERRAVFNFTLDDCTKSLAIWDAVYDGLLDADGINFKYREWLYLYLHQRTARLYCDKSDAETALYHIEELEKCIRSLEENTVGLTQMNEVIRKEHFCQGEDFSGRKYAYILLNGYIKNGYYSFLEKNERFCEFLERLKNSI